MIETYLLGKNTWVDVTNPSEQELAELLLKYDIDMPAQVLLDFSMQSGIKKRSDLIYTVLRFPRLYEDHNAPNRTSFEIDFICTENLLITVHDIPLFEIDAVKNKLTSTTEDRNHHDAYFMLIYELYSTIRNTLVGINTEIEALESKIFEYYDRKSIIEISNITRSVIHIERSVRTHAPIIERLETIFEKLSSGSLYRRNYVVDLYSEVTSSLTTNRDILIEMRWTHNGLLTYQTNNTLMVFTMISFLALPIAVVSSSLDLLQSINNFSLREAVMIGIAIAMGMILYFFHRNRWI